MKTKRKLIAEYIRRQRKRGKTNLSLQLTIALLLGKNE